MFSGSWKESNMMEINLEIPDQNIDTEGERISVTESSNWLCLFVFHWQNFTVFCVWVALQVVFGSLYRDDVLIKPSRVVSILAAACMLQLVSTVKEVSYCLKHKKWPCWIDAVTWYQLNQALWSVVVHRMAWSSSVARLWRKTSVLRLSAATMLVPVSMAWIQSWKSQI